MTVKRPGVTARARRAKAAKRLRDYKQAAQAVVGDDFSCRRCGRWTGDLQIHHKRPRSLAPELRTVPANLEPLCRKCHNEAHGR
jgi:5-methylcytosine-specific restriction endonuclease McrA